MNPDADSLSEASSKVASPPHMFDQLAPSQEQKPRRFPKLERRNAYTPQDPRTTQQYDAVAPSTSSSPKEPQRQEEPPAPSPQENGGFARTSSNPEVPVWQRQEEPPDLFGRLSSSPAWFPSPNEPVKVMQQSSREAWKIFGRRFSDAHSVSPVATSDPARELIAASHRRRRSVASTRPSEHARRSSVAAGSGAPQREEPSHPRSSTPASYPLPLTPNPSPQTHNP